MNISIITNLTYHTECLAFLLELLKEHNVDVYVNNTRYDYIEYFAKFYIFKKYNVEDFLLKKKKYDVIIKLTANENLEILSTCCNIISIIHREDCIDNFTKTKFYISLYPPIKKSIKNAEIILPIYNCDIEEKRKNLIVYIGSVKYDNDLIDFIEKCTNYDFMIFTNNNSFKKNIKNLKIMENIGATDMFNYIKYAKFLLCRNYPHQKNTFSGAISIALSFRIPMIFHKKYKEIYDDFPGISFDVKYLEIINKINNIDDITYRSYINEIIRYTSSKMMTNLITMQNLINNIQKTKRVINLIYYRSEIGNGNFGDELSIFIVDNLINKNNYRVVYNKKDDNNAINLLCVGSYLHKLRKKCVVYGSGIRTEKSFVEAIKNISNLDKINICSVRGPETKQICDKLKIKCSQIYGDPALLIRIFYKPEFIDQLKDKICIVPHITNYEKYKNINNNIYHVVNPTEKYNIIINIIYSCKYVISASLHGIICADAYDKANIWLYEYELNEGKFKFKDYFMSQNRNIQYISSINEFTEEKLYRGGNKIDLNLLKDAFPFS
jgi:pyruvyltransferase